MGGGSTSIPYTTTETWMTAGSMMTKLIERASDPDLNGSDLRFTQTTSQSTEPRLRGCASEHGFECAAHGYRADGSGLRFS